MSSWRNGSWPRSAIPIRIAVLDGIAQETTADGRGLLLLTDVGESALAMESASMDGVILLGCSGRIARSIDIQRRRAIPAVALGGPAFDGVLTISLDDDTASERAARHLADLGHTDVAIVALPLDSVDGLDERGPLTPQRERAGTVQVTLDRLRGVRAVFPDSGGVVTTGSYVDEGMLAGHALLDDPDHRPTAILAQSDLLAAGVIRAAEDLGLQVPRDLSVVGFDGIALDRIIPHDLTTLVQPAAEQGRAAGGPFSIWWTAADPSRCVSPAPSTSAGQLHRPARWRPRRRNRHRHHLLRHHPHRHRTSRRNLTPWVRTTFDVSAGPAWPYRPPGWAATTSDGHTLRPRPRGLAGRGRRGPRRRHHAVRRRRHLRTHRPVAARSCWAWPSAAAGPTSSSPPSSEWTPTVRTGRISARAAPVATSVRQSRRRCGGLNTDWIDLYQLHQPDPLTPIEETLAALDELVADGKVRYVGHSNFSGWQLADAAWVPTSSGRAPFISAQNEYSLLNRGIERDLIPAAESFGIGVLPFFPLANGLLSGKYTRSDAPAGSRLREQKPHLLDSAPWDALEQLQEFADRRGVRMLEVAFGWLLSRPQVSSVIAGATTPDQVVANAAAATAFVPNQQDLDEIDTILPPPAD